MKNGIGEKERNEMIEVEMNYKGGKKNRDKKKEMAKGGIFNDMASV